jgi:FKBP12-rapamycin complex-associated protein
LPVLFLLRQDQPIDVLKSYKKATQLDPEWYKAWHTWALANFEVIQHLEGQENLVYSDVFATYVVPAVHGTCLSWFSFVVSHPRFTNSLSTANRLGFFRSIALSKGNSLQDSLRLLTLWFKHGYNDAVNMAITQGAASISIDVWLEVIPQVSSPFYSRIDDVRTDPNPTFIPRSLLGSTSPTLSSETPSNNFSTA